MRRFRQLYYFTLLNKQPACFSLYRRARYKTGVSKSDVKTNITYDEPNIDINVAKSYVPINAHSVNSSEFIS